MMMSVLGFFSDILPNFTACQNWGYRCSQSSLQVISWDPLSNPDNFHPDRITYQADHNTGPTGQEDEVPLQEVAGENWRVGHIA